MKKITEDMILDAMEMGWPRELAEKGYAVFTSDYGNGADHISKIDDMDVFEDDAEATTQAEHDGIKIIHDMKFPLEHEAAYLDTPENRALLASLAL